MKIHRSERVVVDHASAVGEARRRARTLSQELAMGATDAGRVELAITELGTNLVRHAGGGDLLVRAMEGAEPSLEILAVDSGPGMEDPAACLRDGHSTTGTPGTGLGAVRRMSSEFDLMSRSGNGTIVFSRIGKRSPRRLEVGAVCLPRTGEEDCGDAWAVTGDERVWNALLADGLGHGAEAARASEEAVRVFREHDEDPPAQLVGRMHQVLRSTRGAAALVLQADAATERLLACGVGNVSASVVGGEKVRQVTSINGTLGHSLRRVTEFAYTWPRSACVVVHSDGLSSQWSLERYPGWASRHAGLLAGLLWRDFNKSHDDATVLVIRHRQVAA